MQNKVIRERQEKILIDTPYGTIESDSGNHLIDVATVVFIIIVCDIIGNLAKIRPLLWKNTFYSYLNVGWYTWRGADHLYENEIHKKQTNGFLTRGTKPDKKIKNNIILLGDSYVETSHRLNEMPENYLRNNLNNINVISFASWGWATDQQYIHLKKYINEIKPNHVILWFSMNDLKGNKSMHGSMGSKPTFSLKKDKNNNYHLSGPNRMPGKNYFEYSYSYRAINKLIGRAQEKGYTLVPLKVYFKNGIAKVELSIAKAKKLHDKRASIKKREAVREIDKAMKRGRG